MKRKIFLPVFLLFSFCSAFALEVQSETAFQSLFFDSIKYGLTGFCENDFAKEMYNAGGESLKQFYSRKILRFDENNNFTSITIAESLFLPGTGEIDSLYDENDLKEADPFWADKVIMMYNSQSRSGKVQVNDGQSLLDYLEANDSRGITEQEENKQAGKSEEAEEKKQFSYVDRDGILRRFYYDGEGMSVNSYDGMIYITRSFGNEVLRKSFDLNYRLVREEKLSFDTGLKDIKLTDLKSYTYSGDSTVPLSLKEEQPDKNIIIETKFNLSGFAESVKTTHWETESGDKEKQKEEKNGKTAEKIFFVDKTEIYVYDTQNRVSEYELTTFTYKKNLLGRMKTESLKTKYEYFYHADGDETQPAVPPDYNFYEDDKLRIERKYTAADDYTEKMFFTDELYIEAGYKDGVKKSEIIYSNGKETRRREF